MDLTTRYLGLQLPSPLVASASPLTLELDNIRRLEDLGAGAVVLPSIFEEQIEQEQEQLEQLTTARADSFPEATSYFTSRIGYGIGLDHYLDRLRRAAQAVEIPVLASLNGTTSHGWVNYASQIQQAGARALELNIYYVPADTALDGRQVEQRYLDVLAAVRAAVSIPVAVKLSPYFSSIGNMAAQLDQAGAAGLVLFNRFYEPDIDLARLRLDPSLDLSTPAEIRLPLLWIGVLYGRLKASLAASTGVDGPDEVIKYLLAGADVVMTTSALLRHGIQHMQVLSNGLKEWLAARDLGTLDGIRGRMSQRDIPDPTAFERANYLKVLETFRVASRE